MRSVSRERPSSRSRSRSGSPLGPGFDLELDSELALVDFALFADCDFGELAGRARFAGGEMATMSGDDGGCGPGIVDC